MIEIKEFKSSDGQKLISWINSQEELMQFAGSSFTYPLTQQQINQSLQDSNRQAYSVFLKDSPSTATEHLIGHAQIYHQPRSFRLCRLLIGESHARGQGYGEAMVRQLLGLGFEDNSKDFAELNVYEWNRQAIRCYEKVGFQQYDPHAFTTEINGKIWHGINMRIDREQFRG